MWPRHVDERRSRCVFDDHLPVAAMDDAIVLRSKIEYRNRTRYPPAPPQEGRTRAIAAVRCTTARSIARRCAPPPKRIG
jgi:hypothetical protein